MKKAMMFRSALAMGMAFTLAATPMSVMAESVSETELLEDVEEAVEDTIDDAMEDYSIDDLAADSYVTEGSVTFGDAMYNLMAESGVEVNWLQNMYYYVKIIPSDEGCMQSDVVLGLNDTDLLNVNLFMDLSNGQIDVNIPELFKQPATVSLPDLLNNLASFTGEAQGTEDSGEGDVNNVIMQMIMGYAGELAADAQNVIASIPAETWQQEMVSYMMPIMNSIAQTQDTGKMTVGDMEADVQIQTYSISSENMGQLISTYLTTLSQDPVIETLLTSDFVTNALGLVAMFSGASEVPTGEEILAQFRNVLDTAAAQDFSGMPGLSLSLFQDEVGTAVGYSVDMDVQGEQYNLCAFYAINKGKKNAIQFSPSQTFMSMLGLDASNKLDIVAKGTTENNMLNEEVDIIVNDIYKGIITFKDVDLEAMQQGQVIGVVDIQVEDYDLVLTYDVTAVGSQTLEYTVNGEVFYYIDTYSGPDEDKVMAEVDFSNTVPVTNISELLDYVSTADIQNFMGLLEQAGVPTGSEETTVAA